LGAGGMGEVYRATDSKLGRDVALKIISPALRKDEIARTRLLREARSASTLNHPHICTIYEVGEAGDQAYIAMELVEGQPLSRLISSDGLPLDTLLRYATQIADALAHAHGRNIVHRDLKSSNVVITPEGRSKLLDFGLAKQFDQAEAAAATASLSPVTQAGAIAGTLHYIAPELLRGDQADPRSDVWALGIVLHEMAGGSLPFEGRTGFEISSAILREPPRPLPAKVPVGLRGIIQRCLEKEPARRYQAAGEVRAALEAIHSTTGSGVAITIPAANGTSTRAQYARMAGVFAGGVLLLGIGYVVWDNFFSAHSRHKQPPDPSSFATLPPPGGPAANAGTPSPAGRGRLSNNPEANANFEKSMLFMNSRFELPRARAFLEHALELDPKFAMARNAYALTHILQVESGISNDREWIYKADQEAQRALADDPESAGANPVLAMICMFQGKGEEGIPIAQRSLQLSPNLVSSLQYLTMLQLMNGDYPEALKTADQNIQANPVFFPAQWTRSVILNETGDTAGAIQQLTRTLEQDPQNPFMLSELAHIRIREGDTRAAHALIERARPEDRSNFRVRLLWSVLFAKEGNRKEALREMDAEVLKYADVNPRTTLDVVETYTLLGDRAKAIEWLDRMVRNGDARDQWYLRNPALAPLRNEARFKHIVESIVHRREQRKGK
ncbi:MAG: protein kinase, partial [Acidobacteria bacterium]|nr:protein kinase [Acidobacteriota bacterium]